MKLNSLIKAAEALKTTQSHRTPKSGMHASPPQKTRFNSRLYEGAHTR